MTRYSDLPKPIRSGIVVMHPLLPAPERIIILQFNPATLERTLAAQTGGGEQQGDRVEALRLKGPAVETWNFTAELDSIDQLDPPSPTGIHPQLAALEMLIQPTSAQVRETLSLSARGTLELAPIEAPFTLFVWGEQRVMPVRLTELTITEEAFDPQLNPIRATVGIGLRVLTVSDLPAGHRGGELYLAHLAQKERQAARLRGGVLTELGITAI